MLSLETFEKAHAPRLGRALADLAKRQQESPGFAPVEMLRAVLTHLPGGSLLTLRGPQGPVLACGVRQRAWPLPIAESWITPLTSTGLPSVDTEYAAQALAGLVADLDRPLLLREVPLAAKLVSQLKSAGAATAMISKWQRAVLTTTGSYEQWLTGNFDQKRRKELKRLRARLMEQGNLEFLELASGGDAEPFISEFLRLEASGWKARRGTALIQSAPLVASLRQGLADLHAAGKLRFWMICKDGQAIASLFALAENGKATLGKIAYDESWAKFSPGVLVVLEATAALFKDPTIHFADSNAVPDHPMINRIWRDRMEMANILLAPARMGSRTFAVYAAAERLRHAARTAAKTVYHALRKVVAR